MRRLIIGDIHGMYDRMMDVLDNAGFDPKNDALYSVGDLCDRGEQNTEVLDYLMKLKCFLPVSGNHDIWLHEYLSKVEDPYWVSHNGGENTFNELEKTPKAYREKVRAWLGSFPVARAIDGYIIIHGGTATMRDEDELSRMGAFDMTVEKATRYRMFRGGRERISYTLTMDTMYMESALNPKKASLKPFVTDRTIICGHMALKDVFRSKAYHVIDIDTGSFLDNGFLTVMDLDTGEVFRSR